MTTILILIITLLVISVTANIIFTWYIKKVWNDFKLTESSLVDISEFIAAFYAHLDALYEHVDYVYNLPVYHGEGTIQRLHQHLKDIIEFIKENKEVYSYTQPNLSEELTQEGLNDGFTEEEKTEEKEEKV